MKSALITILAAIVFFPVAKAYGKTMSAAPLKTKFGGIITLVEALSLSKAIATHKENSSKEVLINAKVEKVCSKKGCWMGIGENDLKVRVTFKDYGFFVPTSLIGKEVQAQGILEVKTMSVEEAIHLAEDEGQNPEEIAKIEMPIREYRFIASAVELVSR